MKKIMVVDDDPDTVDAILTMLEAEGYKVIPAYSGRECLKKLKREKVDVVFLDLMMPEMDGLEILKNIKEMHPETHVIILTAFATVDSAIEAGKLGAFNYLRKPFSMDDLITTVSSAVESMKFENEYAVSLPNEESGFRMFKKLACGEKGLYITPNNPENINKKYGLKNMESIWITDKGEGGGKGVFSVHPKKLDELKKLIKDFVRRNENTAVLISGVDYLIDKNVVGDVKAFFSELQKEICSKNIHLILSVTKKKLSEDVDCLISEISLPSVFDAVSDPLRTRIMLFLSSGRKYRFTEIEQKVKTQDCPRLSYHLKKLKSTNMLGQDSEEKYFITDMGKRVVKMIKEISKRPFKYAENVMWV